MEPDAELESKLNEALGIGDAADKQGGEAVSLTATEAADQAAAAVDQTAEGDGVTQPPAGDVPADGSKPVDAAKEQPPEAKKPAEPDIYAPLPEHNPRKTHERFAKLIEGHKAAEAKLAEYEPIVQKAQELEAKVAEHERGWEIFRGMGYTDEGAVQDLQEFAHYRAALAKQDWRSAKGILQEHAKRLALLSGERIEADPLSEDLRQGVTSGTMDEASARELARLRYMEAMGQQRAQQQRDDYQRQQQAERGIHGAALAVDGIVRVLQRDPDYARVEPELLKQLDGIKQNYPPQMWAQEVKRAYDTEARILRLQVPQQQTRSPLRPSGVGSARPAPRSAQEAVLQALELPLPEDWQ